MLRRFLIGAGMMALMLAVGALTYSALIWADSHLGTGAALIALAGFAIVAGGVINAVFG